MLTLALTFVGVLSMNAQSWTSSEVAPGFYTLYNVGTGQYFTKGNGWGTQASITGNENTCVAVELIQEGNDWFIRTGVNDYWFGLEHLSGGTCYTDQSRNKRSSWTFTQVGTVEDPVYTICSASNHGGGAGKYLVAEGGGSTVLAPMDDNSSDNAKWKLHFLYPAYDQAKLLSDRQAAFDALSTATPTNPVDATDIILGGNFTYGATADYWTIDAGNRNMNGGSLINPCAESWRSTFTISQKLTGLPEGTYVIKAQAALSDYAHKYDGANYPVVFANDKTSVFNEMIEADRETSMTQLSGSFTAGRYEVAPLTVEVPDDGEITLGVRGTRNDTWCIWDNFRLIFYGFNLEALVADYENQLEGIKALKGDMNKDVATQLSDAISADATLDKSDKTAIRAALVAIGEAREAATASIDDYKKMADEIAAFKKNYKDGDATAIEEKYAAGTYVTYDEFAADLQNAKLAALGQEDGTDYTSLLVNASPYANLDGWETEGTKPNAYDTGNQNAEYWNISGSRFYQTLKDMPAGVYTLTAIALTRTGMQSKVGLNGTEQQIAQVESSVVNNRGQANSWFNAGNGINTVSVTLPHGGDLTVWLKSDDTTGDHWTVWRSFSLSYSTIKDLIFVDAGTEKFQATKAKAGEYDDITATITGGGDLAGTKDNLKDGIRIVYENTDALNENLYTAGFKAEAEIDDNAGTVYTVKAREIDGVIKLAQGLFGPNTTYNVTLKPIVYYNYDKFCDDEAATLSATYGLTLEACDPLPMWSNGNTYPFTITTNGTVKQDIQSLVKTNTVTAKNAWGEDITAELLGIGGTATGINGVNAAANGNAIYNLAGQRVSKTQKGVYVVNGKKVAVK